MKELCVGWMNDSKKGAFKRPSYTYLWRTINVVDAAFVKVMSSVIPTTVTEIGLSCVDLLGP